MKLKSLFGALACTTIFATTAAHSAALYLQPAVGEPLAAATNNFTSFGLDWTALSTYSDSNNNGIVDIGESVVDTVVRNFSEAGVTIANNYGDISLIPQIAGFGSNYGQTWGLYFDYTLNGTVLASSGSEILANYTSGIINIYYDDYSDRTAINAGRDILVDNRVMEITVDGSGGAIANFLLFGEVTDVDSDFFFFANGVDFADQLASAFVINTRVDTNLDTNIVPSSDGAETGTLSRTSTLNGSARFDVPEPGVVALLGLGLMGLGAVRRFKKIS